MIMSWIFECFIIHYVRSALLAFVGVIRYSLFVLRSGRVLEVVLKIAEHSLWCALSASVRCLR